MTVHEEKYRGCTIRLEHDPDPESPRTWDNVGTMVCWHGRYSLGDRQPSTMSPREYLDSLVPVEVTDWLDERISRIEANTNTGYGRPKRLSRELASRMTERIESAKVKAIDHWLEKNLIRLPLYLYDHSGITMRTDPFGCRWDSGQVGFIYCDLETAAREASLRGTPQAAANWDSLVNWHDKPGEPEVITLRQWAQRVLEGEVESYDAYLRGDIVGYIAEDPDGEQIHSCWGFYPERNNYVYAIQEAKRAIDAWYDEQELESAERSYWEEREVVTKG